MTFNTKQYRNTTAKERTEKETKKTQTKKIRHLWMVFNLYPYMHASEEGETTCF